MKQLLTIGAAIVPIAALAAPVGAQELLRVIDGRPHDDLWWIESMSDVDGDQVDDLLVAAADRYGSPGGMYMAQSGRTGDVLWGPITLPPGYATAHHRVLGDFDGDGFDDIAVGYSGLPSTTLDREVRVIDGRDGTVLTVIDVNWSPSGGAAVGDPGDVNDDGFADVIVGGLDLRKDVHLGPDGRYAYSVFGQSTFAQLPRGIGDVTGDGKDDFAIGWWLESLVTVHSGVNGTWLYEISLLQDIPNGAGGFGRWIVPLGDVDGDTVPDFAVENPAGVHPLHGDVGAIRFFSGVDGSLIRTTWGKPGSDLAVDETLGSCAGGGHDVNGDGVADVVTTIWHPLTSHFAHAVVSGRTGQVVAQVRPLDPTQRFTCWDQTLADLNGDGYAEWAYASQDFSTPTTHGRIWIYKGGPGDAETICLGATNSAGSSATLTTFGPIQHRTRELDLVVEGAVPNAFGHVVYGDESTASPFGDGDLCIDPASLRFYGTCFTTDATGRASVHADWGRPQIAHGPGAWLPGSTWVLQAVYRDAGGPSGFTTTSALRVQFFGG